jgi:hypothetical protein
MKLIRKWNPNSAPYISNPGGPKVYRIVALIQDDVSTNYVTFFDSWTKKVYCEKVISSSLKSNLEHTDLSQVINDQEWLDLIEFQKKEEIGVLQSVETSIEKDKDTGEVKLNDGLYEVPEVPYGVDSNGSQLITSSTPVECQISPSLIKEDGTILT